MATSAWFREAASHHASPGERGRGETPAWQVPASPPTPLPAALRQGVTALGRPGWGNLLSPVQGEQPPPAETPTEGMGLTCKAALPHRALLPLPTSPRGPASYPQPPPSSDAMSPGRCSRPFGSRRRRAVPSPHFPWLTRASPRSHGPAPSCAAAVQQKSSLIKRASFGNRQIYCTTQTAL